MLSTVQNRRVSKIPRQSAARPSYLSAPAEVVAACKPKHEPIPFARSCRNGEGRAEGCSMKPSAGCPRPVIPQIQPMGGSEAAAHKNGHLCNLHLAPCTGQQPTQALSAARNALCSASHPPWDSAVLSIQRERCGALVPLRPARYELRVHPLGAPHSRKHGLDALLDYIRDADVLDCL